MSKVVKRYTFAGLPIAVENPAGSERTWERDGGVPGRTVMRHDYGFIEDQDGKDGDELDCYVGPNPNARFAYVVHQLKRPGYRDHDEDKVFLGFDSEEAARSAFAAHRDDELSAYGGMTSIPIGDFVAKLERRTGSGKIRHDAISLMHLEHRADGWHVLSEDRSKHLGGPYSTKEQAEKRLAQVEAFKHKHGVFQPFENPHELAAMLEARGLYEVAIGRSLAFDTARGSDGQVRAQVWDRGMTFGEKVKDGQRSEFSLETFNQFLDNWLKRGERISLCYNHQSAYVAQNGQPAPALAQYDAVAIVQGGEVVRCEKLHASSAQPPSVLELQQRVRALATDLDPRPTPDGMWFFRCEVTPLGQQLLPNFSYISPMFTSNGKDEQGNAQGYTLIDLAATNTAFQAGCVISFDRQKGARTMSVSHSSLRNGDRVEYRGSDGRTHAGRIIGIDSDPNTRIRIVREDDPDRDDWVTSDEIARKLARYARFDAVRPGDRVISKGRPAIVVAVNGDRVELRPDYENPAQNGPNYTEDASSVRRAYSWFGRARARVLEQRTLVFDFRRGRRRLLEQRRAQRFGAGEGPFQPGDRVRRTAGTLTGQVGKVIEAGTPKTLVEWPNIGAGVTQTWTPNQDLARA